MNHRFSHHRNVSDGETGRTFEMDRLYPMNDIRRRIIEILLKAEDIPYSEYRAAMQDVLNNANGSGYSKEEAAQPPARWLQEVHGILVKRLCPKKPQSVRCYPALGTAMDRYHGTDLIVAYDDPGAGTIMITVDLTKNPHKQQYKADVIVTPRAVFAHDKYDVPAIEAPFSPDDEGDARYMKGIADVICSVLHEKAQEAIDAKRRPAFDDNDEADGPTYGRRLVGSMR